MVEARIEFVRRIGEIIVERQLTHVEVRDGPLRISLSRNLTRLTDGAVSAQNVPSFYSSEVALSNVPGECDGDHQETVRSHAVGTVYLVDGADGRGSLRSGDLVEGGDLILTIKVLNTSNPIFASSTGVILELFVEDGQPVEFDQPLFLLGGV